MKCPKCRNEINANAVTCPICSHPTFLPTAVTELYGKHRSMILITVAAILVCSLLAACFGGGRSFDDALEQYILGITSRDGETMCELLPDDLLDAMTDPQLGGESREELARYLGNYAGQEFRYGIVTVLSYEVKDVRKAESEDLADINEMLADLNGEAGIRLTVTEARTAQVNIEFDSPLFGRQITVVYLTLYKIGGEWCYLPQ